MDDGAGTRQAGGSFRPAMPANIDRGRFVETDGSSARSVRFAVHSYPCGFACCHRHESAHIRSMPYCARHPSSASASLGSA